MKGDVEVSICSLIGFGLAVAEPYQCKSNVCDPGIWSACITTCPGSVSAGFPASYHTHAGKWWAVPGCGGNGKSTFIWPVPKFVTVARDIWIQNVTIYPCLAYTDPYVGYVEFVPVKVNPVAESVGVQWTGGFAGISDTLNVFIYALSILKMATETPESPTA